MISSAIDPDDVIGDDLDDVVDDDLDDDREEDLDPDLPPHHPSHDTTRSRTTRVRSVIFILMFPVEQTEIFFRFVYSFYWSNKYFEFCIFSFSKIQKA